MGMKVGLVTNWNERCAVAEYAKNLVKYCLLKDKDIEFKVIAGLITAERVQEEVKGVDVIHYNYCHHAFTNMNPQGWHQTGPLPRIMTLHESTDWYARRLIQTNVVDLILMHDRIRDGAPMPYNVETVPYGVPDFEPPQNLVVERKVGTFGAAYPWKGLWPLAYACGELHVPVMMMLSEPDTDKGLFMWERLQKEIMAVCPWADIRIGGWFKDEEILTELSKCAVVAFPFDPAAQITGISSSVRYGLAARRPLVLTRMAHFSDLFDYEDELYFTNGDLPEALKEALDDVEHGIETIPYQALEMMSWHRAAEMYMNIYHSIKIVEVTNAG